MKLKQNDIPLNDPYVYKFVGTGQTKGIFQIESPGMQNLMKQMFSDVSRRISAIEEKYECTGFENPASRTVCTYKGSETDTNKIEQIKENFKTELEVLGNEMFERIVAAISLYRPGPMDYIPDYIKGMNDPEAIEYDCPELEEILSRTYGVIVYQEQVQQIVRKLAGYSLGRGDLIRRAMGKKKTAIMDAEKEVFLHGNEGKLKEGEQVVPGCIKNGISEEAAMTIWDKMAKFALYAFNKSHSAGYAVITVQTAWLKFYYPIDFLVATLNSVIDNSKKLNGYIAEAAELDIKILTPDINKSQEMYCIEGDSIRTGLRSLRNLGKMALPIIEERKSNGEFKDIYDYINRMISNVDKKVLESLIYSGALDCFEGTRNSKITSVPAILDYIKYVKKGIFEEIPFELPVVNKLYSKLGELEIEEIEEFEELYLLDKEYEYTGMFISGHPLNKYKDILELKGTLNLDVIIPEKSEDDEETVTSDYDGAIVSIAGIVRNLKQIVTKKGDKMYTFTLEDKTEKIRCVAFPKVTKTIEILLEEKALLHVSGKVQDNDGDVQLIVDDAKDLKSVDFSEAAKLYINLSSQTTVPTELSDLITKNPGTTTVMIKTATGWIVSKTKFDLTWTNYLKLKNEYQLKLGK